MDLTLFYFDVAIYVDGKTKSMAIIYRELYNNSTVWKMSKYGVFSGLYFPIFGLKLEIYSKSPY